MKNKFKKFVANHIRFAALIVAIVLFGFFIAEVTAKPTESQLEKAKKILPFLPYSPFSPPGCRCRPCCKNFAEWSMYYQPVTKEKMSSLTEIQLK